MYKKYGDISNHTDPGAPPTSTLDLEERKDSDHEILVTIALLKPDARYTVSINQCPLYLLCLGNTQSHVTTQHPIDKSSKRNENLSF